MFLEFRWNLRFHHVFSDAGPRKHQCPGLNSVAHVVTSLALCKQVSVLPSFVHSVCLNIDVNMILSSKDSGFCRLRYLGTVLLDVKSGSTWKYVPNELHVSVCQIQISDIAVFVPYVLDGRGFETPTHNAEAENT